MILIEEVDYKGTNVRFYNGVDFDILMKHAKDGSDGFIYCFMNSWEKEVQSYNRNNKLKSIIEDKDYSDFEWESIDNNYVAIYQADGIDIELLYRTIRDKVLQNYLSTSSYLHITSLDRGSIVNSGGAWKIEVSKNES